VNVCQTETAAAAVSRQTDRQTDRQRVSETFKSFDEVLIKDTAAEDGLERDGRLTDCSEELSDVAMFHQFTHVDHTLHSHTRQPTRPTQSRILPGWHGTLCDPTWHVSSCSSDAGAKFSKLCKMILVRNYETGSSYEHPRRKL